jgi:hypothetical protein
MVLGRVHESTAGHFVPVGNGGEPEIVLALEMVKDAPSPGGVVQAPHGVAIAIASHQLAPPVVELDDPVVESRRADQL